LGYFWQIPVYMRWLPAKPCNCHVETWLASEPSQTLHIGAFTTCMRGVYLEYLKNEIDFAVYESKYLEIIRNMKLQPSLRNAVDGYIHNHWQYPMVVCTFAVPTTITRDIYPMMTDFFKP
jgi:hypothetical protein